MKKRFSARTLILAGSFLLQLSALCFHSHGAPGDVDLSFDPGSGVNGIMTAIVVQPDGRVIIAGHSTTDEGLDRSMVVRFNANGSLDSSFTAGTTAGDGVYVSAIALQSDGKVLVGQDYGVTRLNSNGDRDSSFNLYAVGGDYSGATSLAVQPDGKVLVGGYAVTRIYDPEGYVDYYYSYFVTRVHANGSRDTSFQPVFGDPLYGGGVPVRALALQPDGKVVVDGTSLHLGTIARLNANGTLDGSFNSGTAGIVKSVALQPDGKVLVGGQYIGSGTNRNAIARLNADGSLDSSFNPGTGMGGESPWVESVVVQANGKVLVGGDFTTVNGTNRNHIARLNANGSLDNSFDPGTGADQSVRSIALQSDRKVFIGGNFYMVNGVRRQHVARLLGDSPAPPNDSPSVSIVVPTEGSTFAAPATIGITVEASDSDGFVTRVDVYANGTLIGTDPSAPFEISWNDVAAGSYAITAMATDNLGANSNSAPVNISVTNAAPEVAITSPVSGATFTAPGTVAIAVNATDGDGTIARVDVYVGETLIGSDTSAPFEAAWNNPSAGNYSITADAIDNLGATTTSAAIDVLVTTPLPAAPSGLIATAISRNRIILAWTDNSPNELGFKIERSTNGKPFKAIATVGANVTSFENTGLAPGTKYSYRVRAYNAVGNSGFSNKATARTSRRFMSWLPFDS